MVVSVRDKLESLHHLREKFIASVNESFFNFSGNDFAVPRLPPPTTNERMI